MTEALHTPPFEAPTPGHLAELFPSYDIVRLIACGGMGAVYEAVQRSLERPVAIKILPTEFSGDESFRQSFQAEAKAMARLNHPNLIGVYDFGEIEGMLFIVMEYVSGGSLYHATDGHPIEQGEAARIIAAVCDGLAHAHEHGILHRDIKPANILLDQQARPKIGDFGLARPIGHYEDGSADVFGTPHYTAPEVVNRPTAVDARADIFSIGVVLHELLTGKVPAADPRVPSMICNCDIGFDAIIRRATNPMSEMRYPSVAAMAQELHVLQGSLARTPAAGPGRPPRPPRASYVRPKKSGGGFITTILILAAVAGLAWFIVQHGLNFNLAPKAEPAPQPAATESESSSALPSSPPSGPDFHMPAAPKPEVSDSPFGSEQPPPVGP